MSGILFNAYALNIKPSMAEFTAKFIDVALTNVLANRRLLVESMKLSMGPGQARSSLVEGIQRTSLLRLFVGYCTADSPIELWHTLFNS